MTPDFRPEEDVLSGDTADIYFARAQTILRNEGLNPLVTMETFTNGPGILCGMREVLALLREVLPADADVWALGEGERMSAKEVVLRITAPYGSFGLYETAYLGMLAHQSGWATAARRCVEAAEGIPIISFGARHVHPRVAARLEYAAMVGGFMGCATPAGARLGDVPPSGTIPHAMILIVGDTVQATKAFDRHIPPEVNRIALVDTFKDEAEESIRVAEALGDKLWGVRLDTPGERGRVTPDLVKEVRARLDQAGYQHVKIVVSGGIDEDRIRLFVDKGAPVDAFGVGSAVSSAPPIDFTADIKAIEGKPVAKRGRIPGITDNPRLRKVELSATGAD
ncbi:MAG: nicotinate phosphoribosyltransferase [Anaerolineae bacterium]|nr:nicotinate phosphoribosyltransferase [Anaerolineae bacterium]NIN93959.1 nicotinate phosphoribosyltransferase [Anaerolineae bacterium]NIQ76992.1 nicotinate phosphoribosyltransferase [Anaerolineae bacterium]